ncbi:hypothetical protein R3P38DRAFT_2802848 [Favolaschia claudopus]|uniref:Uncharacterized protein n=1 Tax=Favolaschia claudopus TaxID=2862362 RepID=A0AAV9ZVD4_9AGAR
MFCHMGPAIVDNWAELYSTEGENTTTEAMRTGARHLPPLLTAVQRLMFKPQPDMSDEEIQSLRSALGTTDAEPNPIVRYFAERAAYAKQFTQSELAKPYPQRLDPSSSSQSTVDPPQSTSATQLTSDRAEGSEEFEESENAMTAAAAALEIAMELFEDVEGIGDGMDLVDDAMDVDIMGGDLPVLTDSSEEEGSIMFNLPLGQRDLRKCFVFYPYFGAENGQKWGHRREPFVGPLCDAVTYENFLFLGHHDTPISAKMARGPDNRFANEKSVSSCFCKILTQGFYRTGWGGAGAVWDVLDACPAPWVGFWQTTRWNMQIPKLKFPFVGVIVHHAALTKFIPGTPVVVFEMLLGRHDRDIR